MTLKLIPLLISLSGCAVFVPFVEPDEEVKKPSPVREVNCHHNSAHKSKFIRQVPQNKFVKRPSRLEQLKQKLNSADSTTRAHAAFWIGEMKNNAHPAIPLLISRLQDDDNAWVRRASAKALGKIGAKEALPALYQAKNDTNKYVAHSATNAITALEK